MSFNGEDIIYASRYPTLQLAINDAPIGAIVVLRTTTYVENITISKSLKLMGGGPTAVIRGNISVTALPFVIEDVKILNGTLTLTTTADTANFTVRNVQFDNSFINVLAAPAAYLKLFLVENCDFIGSTTAGVTMINFSTGRIFSGAIRSCNFEYLAANQTGIASAAILSGLEISNTRHLSQVAGTRFLYLFCHIDPETAVLHNYFFWYTTGPVIATTQPLVTIGEPTLNCSPNFSFNRMSQYNGHGAGAQPTLLLYSSDSMRMIGNEFDTADAVKINPGVLNPRTGVISGNAFRQSFGTYTIDLSAIVEPRFAITGNVTGYIGGDPINTFLNMPLVNKCSVTGNVLWPAQVIANNAPFVSIGNITT